MDYSKNTPLVPDAQMLSEAHWHMLTEGSGIAPEVIAERGYRTSTGYSELKSLGILARRDTHTKGLLLPVMGLQGKPVQTYIAREDRSVPMMLYRPDTPQINSEGHAQKYLYPGHQGMRLDVHPRSVPHLSNPAIPLWITEGIKKSDSLVTPGLCALTLLGVDCWRGTNQYGGKGALPEWQDIALNGREVRIVFDSDIMDKATVERALLALASYLTSKGAHVHAAYLPSDDGRKVGVDDYLLTHAPADLEHLLEVPRRARPKPAKALPTLKLLKNGEPRAVLFNILEILTQDAQWAGVFGYDAFAYQETLLQRPPYLTDDGPWEVRQLTDEDDLETSNWLQREYNLCAAKETVHDAMQVLAHRHPYHPVRDYLRSQQWDGTPRLDTWLSTYCCAEDTPYTRAVGAKTLLSLVARVEDPGCKSDCVMILQGAQGLYKSTVLETLVGREWFSDTLPDLERKDAMEVLHGKWLVELGELAVMQRSEREAIKRFVSSPSDHFRPSYGRRARTFPRQTIFAGTTNKDQFLQDETGGRRWWPVFIPQKCDLEALRRDRDQLFAEAFARYQSGAQWYLTPEEDTLAAGEQEERFEVDPWEEKVLRYVHDLEQVSTREIMEKEFLWDNPALWTQANSKRIGAILRHHHWHHQTCRDTDGNPFKGFKKGRGAPPVTDVTDTSDKNDPIGYNAIPYKNNDVTDVTDVTDSIEERESANSDLIQNRKNYASNPLRKTPVTPVTGYNGSPVTGVTPGAPAPLTPPPATDCYPPTGAPAPCYHCRGTTFWYNAGNQPVCSRCHPQPRERS